MKMIFPEERARDWLQFYRDVVARRGCSCVQSGLRTEPCAQLYKMARIVADMGFVEGNPGLTAELRRAAGDVLALEH